MKKLQTMIVSIAALTVLAACGEKQGDRALSGGGIGAGVGAAASVLTGGNPVTGAVVGGAVGAATGALTKKKDINLGKPAWK